MTSQGHGYVSLTHRKLMDGTDRRILDLLRRDARLPTAEVARQVHVSRATAHERIKRLHETGIIRGSHVVMDPAALGRPLRAILLVHLVPDIRSDQRTIGKQIAEIPDVDRVHIVSGRYDFVVEVLAKDMDEIGSIILERIRTIEGVGNTETMLCFWSMDGPGISLD